jgi:HSP90 family molecular chaperone
MPLSTRETSFTLNSVCNRYKEFYLEYSYFLKEGVCHDAKFVDQVSVSLLINS